MTRLMRARKATVSRFQDRRLLKGSLLEGLGPGEYTRIVEHEWGFGNSIRLALWLDSMYP